VITADDQSDGRQEEDQLAIAMTKLKHAEERAAALERELSHTKQKLKVSQEQVSSLQAQCDLQAQVDAEEEMSDTEESVVDPQDSWMAKFLCLRDYRILNGHCNVPRSHKLLGTWTNNQRSQFKNHKLKPERIHKLDSIGFHWGKGFPKPMAWEEGYAELQKFKSLYGHCNVTINETNPSPQAKWVSMQRSEYRRSKQGKDSLLTLDQVAKLKEIGFLFRGPHLV